MEHKINEMWLARDKDGDLAMYENKPFKNKLAEQWLIVLDIYLLKILT